MISEKNLTGSAADANADADADADALMAAVTLVR
jgi:hypothetical protein